MPGGRGGIIIFMMPGGNPERAGRALSTAFDLLCAEAGMTGERRRLMESVRTKKPRKRKQAYCTARPPKFLS
jgi:hypothetical protein